MHKADGEIAELEQELLPVRECTGEAELMLYTHRSNPYILLLLLIIL